MTMEKIQVYTVTEIGGETLYALSAGEFEGF